MAKIGKMVACVIGSMTDDGQMGADRSVIYRDFEDSLRGGVFAEIERLQTIYLWCCLCVVGMQQDDPKRPEFLSNANNYLWYVVQGKTQFEDGRAKWPIVDAIKAEFDKLTPQQKFDLLD